jgi:tetratricopeptide (TPR) repeat protein
MANRHQAIDESPVKSIFQTLLLALALVGSTYGAEIELRIELPDMELLLPPVSPPLLQREGVNLPNEQILIGAELAPLIAVGSYEEALDVLRDGRERLVDLLELGDPQNELAQMAVPGGFNVGRGGGLVSAALLQLAGHIYFALDRYIPAELAFQSALRVIPDYVRVHQALGLLYIRLERYPEARVHITRAAALGLTTPSLFGALGYVNHQTRSYLGAASAFQHALALEPGNGNWERGLLNALTQTDQYVPGRALVEEMLLQSPDDSDLWVYRAQLSLLDDRRAEALASLEAAIRLGDETVSTMQACATLHMERGSIARAVELLGAAYAAGMEFRYLDQALAWLAQNDEWDELRALLAAVDAERSSLTSAAQSKLLTREADVRLHDGQRSAAGAALEDAISVDPNNGEALMALAQFYYEDRDNERAELMYQRAGTFDTYRENSLISRAQLAIEVEDFERAIQLLRDVVSANPARADLRRNIESLQNLVQLRTND